MKLLVLSIGMVVLAAATTSVWLSVQTLSKPAEVVGETRTFEVTKKPVVKTEETVLIPAKTEATESTSTPEHFSDFEPGFESVEDDTATSAPVVAASPPPPIGQGRIQWSQYWVPFTEAEAKLYANWQRPVGPTRVGLQAGHWKLTEVPEELAGLRTSSGAHGGGYSEQEAVLIIAQKTKALLEKEGIVVDLFPATVPVDYIADAFVSIHADGNNSSSISGFKVSGPRRDFSGGASALVSELYHSYGSATELRRDANVTRRMSGYYAFNWRRYDHAVHPMTPAAIIETGFITSPTDRAVIVSNPDLAAQGIANGILGYLEQ